MRGDGNVCFNCSSNSGTGGVSFSSGEPRRQRWRPWTTPGTRSSTELYKWRDVAIDGNHDGAQQRRRGGGLLPVAGTDGEPEGSYTYKDWNGNSQWYMVKDASNNWALNSATGGLDSFKPTRARTAATLISMPATRRTYPAEYEGGAGAETDIYSGSSANLVAAFFGTDQHQASG